ncbi:MAG: carbohydrate-binding protein [Prolixibacteraceae bacterium]|nr:carbohydrate-binding protein [Prolixibacteraceae bacterium]
MSVKQNSIIIIVLLLFVSSVSAKEYHVAKNGTDTNTGNASKPFLTIQHAANFAYPGDTITVHKGVYRERINPPRGGTDEDKRIVFQAATGEKVLIKGSEQVTGWKKVENDTWMVKIPNSFFGDFNPYSDVISGDWYEADQPYHSGAVYLNGHWLKEAAVKHEVVKSETPKIKESGALELVNVESLFLNNGEAGNIPASGFSACNREVGFFELPEEKKCIGKMQDGDWLAFDNIDFGEETKFISILSASPEHMAMVEIRKDRPDGELLGICRTGITAEWTHFQPYRADIKPLSGKQRIVLVFKTRQKEETFDGSEIAYWFSKVDEDTTTIWAEFKNVDPNEALIEINVRQTVFYPKKTGIDYITVSGFILEQAATPWAPPTAEQIGLVGTNWSKGWVIENNTIRYSTCTGVTLGKYGDEFDNTYNYPETINRAVKKGWNRETVGSHVVKNNQILHCGQAGINGSLGCSFSTIIGNTIHDIRKNHFYKGCETAGIKLHGAVDVLIKNNHIYRCEHWGGIWLDWMAQGARVTGNLLHDNSNDLMLEVNHGPFMVDNNLFLSDRSLVAASGGGAYVHNLWCGSFSIWPNLVNRLTPYFKPHSVDINGNSAVDHQDERHYNNIFINRKPSVVNTEDVVSDDKYNELFADNLGLCVYDQYEYLIQAEGNVYLPGSRPFKHEKNYLQIEHFNPQIKLLEKDNGWWLEMNVDPAWQEKCSYPVITSKLLGEANISSATFETRDKSPYLINTDYSGKKRDANNPFPGPFEINKAGKQTINVWPNYSAKQNN